MRNDTEFISAFRILAFGVLHDTAHQFQYIVLIPDITEWIVMHGLSEVDRIQYFYLVSALLQHFPAFKNHRPFGEHFVKTDNQNFSKSL